MSGNGTSVVELRNGQDEVTGYMAGHIGMRDSVWASSDTPDAPVTALKEYLTAYAQTLRQEAETLGVDVNGSIFSTDVGSQVKYVGILVYASMDKTYSGTWQTQTGFVTLDAGGVVVMTLHVMAYLQVCFAWEQAILAQIEAATTVEELQQIDLTTGRPAGQLPPPVISGIYASVGALASTSLAGSDLAVSGTAAVAKLKGASAIPTVEGGPGAGSTAMLSLTTGSTDLAGQISVVASGTMSPESDVVIASVVFSEPFDTVPFVTFSPANVAAGSVTCAPFVVATDTGFELRTSNTSGMASTTHLFNYVVVQ